MTDYMVLLRQKAQKEYDDFIDKLIENSGKYALDHAYEKVIKEDFLNCILNESLDRDKAKGLYIKSYPLDYCYQEWLKNDYSHMEMLQNTTNEAGQKASKELCKDNRESR